MGGFYEPALDVVYIPSAQFPSGRTQAYSHTSLQVWLGMQLIFVPGEKMKWSWGPAS